MKTTIDIPSELLRSVKISAAERRTTLKEIVLTGLDWVLQSDSPSDQRDEALQRMNQGFRPGGQPIERQAAHARNEVS